MDIIISNRFYKKLEKQVKFISLDKKDTAFKFKNELLNKIRNISTLPYNYKKSTFFDNKNIRELVFKGYRIVFEIDIEKNTIIVFGFNKWENNLNR